MDESFNFGAKRFRVFQKKKNSKSYSYTYILSLFQANLPKRFHVTILDPHKD